MKNGFISYSHAADEKLAGALRTSLEKFAKPWYKIRNLNVFQDYSSLSASPDLWKTIQQALNDAEYFIYMASPEAAASKWVQKELDFWLGNKTFETIIIVVTGGNLMWDDQKNCFLQTDNNCLPSVLLNRFSSEPLYIDFRNFKDQADLSLSNPAFYKSVLKIAAKLHNKEPKDLSSDEITEHSKTIRLRNTIIVVLSFLLVAAGIAGWIARAKSKEARTEANTAEANYLISEAQREVSVNPTIAIRLAEAAAKKSSNPLMVDITNKIYRENFFYKTILSDEFSTKNQYKSFCCLDVAPDGQSFVVGSRNQTVKIYTMEGKLVHEFTGYKAEITAVTFSHNGRLLITGSYDGGVKLWNINGTLLHEYNTGHTVNSLAFSADGNTILIVSFFKAQLLDLNLAVVHEYPDQVISACFTPDSKTVLIAGVGSASLLDYQGKQLRQYKAAEALHCAFSPDGKHILTASIDSSLQLWNVDGTLIKELRLPGLVNSIAFSCIPNVFAGATTNGHLTIYEADGSISHELRGHTYNVVAGFLPNAGSILSIGDGTVRLWRLNNLPVKVFAHEAHISSVNFAPGGKKIITCSWDQIARLWNEKGDLLHEFKTAVNDFISSAAFSSDGKAILITSPNGCSIYDTSWKLTSRIESVQLNGAIFYPGSKSILLCAHDSTAQLLDESGKSITQFKHKSQVTSASFSPDGKLLFTGTENGLAYLWNMDGKMLQEFKLYSYIPCVAFAPDGKSVVAAGTDFSITMWDLHGKRLQEFKGHSFRVNAMVFSSDGKYLLTCSADNTAKLWTMQGDIVKEISEGANVTSVAISPDSKQFLIGSMNNKAKLWQVPEPLSNFLSSEDLTPLTVDQKKEYKIDQ